MGELLHVNPVLHWPFRQPFQILDQRNGPTRGTWFYRSAFTDSIWGPFHSEEDAETYMWLEGNPDTPVPA